MACVTDDRGRVLDLAQPPRRVVSLVPSSTETLVHLVGRERVVGVTRFCTHPDPWVRAQPKVGGTKDVALDRVLALAPDLVVANAEENTASIVDELDPHVPVYVAFPRSVDDAVDDLARLGQLLGADAQAAAWVAEIRAARAALAGVKRPFTYAYLIWRGPWMSLNDDTFIAAMLAQAGGTNALGAHGDRYPTLTAQDLVDADPDVVLLSSEPFPFRSSHAQELVAETGWDADRVRFVDGELCSWHGVRIAAGLHWLRECLVEGWPTAPTPPAPDVAVLS